MSQITRVFLFTFSLMGTCFIRDTYASNSELEDLRHTHLASYRRCF